MHKQKQHIINSSLFGILTLMFGIGAITVSSVFVIYYIGFLTTILLLKLLNKNTQELSDTITIFTATLLFGFILAFMVNLDFIENGVTFLYPDQMHFFEEAKKLSLSNSIGEVINRAFIQDYRAYQVVYFSFGILGYLDRVVSGVAHFLPLLYSVVYITALIPVFLYHIVKLYVPRSISLKSSLFYALLTPIMAYSGYLLRDMHITLITMIALFWMVREVRIDRLIGVALLIPIAYQIRESNSLLILAMLGIFIFAGKAHRNIKIGFVILGLGFLLYFSGSILDIFTATEGKLENYIAFTEGRVEERAGISRGLYKLPPGVRHISIILFSLSAFPFFTGLSAGVSFPQFIMGIYNSITNIGWFFIFFGVIYFIKPIYNKVLKMPNKIFLYLFALFGLYMLANTTNMTFRRLICVFPFIYIPFLLVYNDVSKEKRKTYKRYALYTGLSLYVVYFLLLI